MQLVTKNKTVNLVIRTRKLVDVANNLKGENFETVYFRALNKVNLEDLSKIIYLLAENEDKTNPFNSSTEVYDFIDDYKAETGKTYIDIFKEIAEVINEEGFFNSKMSKKDLKTKMENPFGQVNLEDVVKSSAEKAITSVAQEQFQGFMVQGFKN
ncbi:MAG: hypothetical protein ACI4ON_00435 [Clostridia bacterium]